MGGFGTTTSIGGFGASAAPGLQQAAPTESFEGERRVKAIQLAYSPYVDQIGNPAQQLVQGVSPNEEKCEFDAVLYDSKASVAANPAAQKYKLSSRRQEEVGTINLLSIHAKYLMIIRGHLRLWTRLKCSYVFLSVFVIAQAERNNPDPASCVPVRILGAAELKSRFDGQCKESEQLAKNVESMREILTRLEQTNNSAALRFEGLRTRQRQLNNKVLATLRKVEVLRCYRVGFGPSEQRFRERLQRLSVSVQGPQEKVLQLANLQAQQEQRRERYDNDVSEEQLEAMLTSLEKHRQGLQILTDIVTKDSRDMNIIKQKLKL
jgi:hypothetical protein